MLRFWLYPFLPRMTLYPLGPTNIYYWVLMDPLGSTGDFSTEAIITQVNFIFDSFLWFISTTQHFLSAFCCWAGIASCAYVDIIGRIQYGLISAFSPAWSTSCSWGGTEEVGKQKRLKKTVINALENSVSPGKPKALPSSSHSQTFSGVGSATIYVSTTRIYWKACQLNPWKLSYQTRGEQLAYPLTILHGKAEAPSDVSSYLLNFFRFILEVINEIKTIGIWFSDISYSANSDPTLEFHIF